MARPQKQTVDYFPHTCTHKKTMHIIEQRYGNDGYAFWFKLLELLGDTEGHYLDLTDNATWEFLQAKTKLSPDLCTEILDLLARLNAIDSELWGKKYVWSANFIDGIAAVYKNRRVNIPEKPIIDNIYNQKPIHDDISTGKNPHSRVEYSIVEESIVEKSKKEFVAENSATDKKDFINGIIQAFADVHGDYEILNIGKERKAAGVILKHYKKKFPAAASAETLAGLKTYFEKCIAIDDKWLKQNMSLSLIVSKFNEINNILKNGKGNKSGISSAYRQKVYNTVLGGLRTATGTDHSPGS